jgi:hypothetical protein
MALEQHYYDVVLISSREIFLIFIKSRHDEMLMHFFFGVADSNLSHEHGFTYRYSPILPKTMKTGKTDQFSV